MFKKKLNLSALATNKPIEQEEIKQEEIKQIEKQGNTNENNSLVNFNYAETIVEKIEEKDETLDSEIILESQKIDSESQTIDSETKNESLIEEK